MLERRLRDFPSGSGTLREGGSLPIEGTLAGRAYTTGEPILFLGSDSATVHDGAEAALIREGIRCVCILPLRARQKVLGTLNVGSRNLNFFRPKDLVWLSQIAGQIAIALENNYSVRQVEELNTNLAELNAQLANEKLYLEDEIWSTSQFEEIIGESPAIRGILHQVEIIAPERLVRGSARYPLRVGMNAEATIETH